MSGVPRLSPAPPPTAAAPRRRAVRALSLAVLVLPIAACARVEVHGDDGVAVRHMPGVVAVSVADAEGPVRVRAGGLGIARTPLGTSLGAWRSDLVAMPPAGCGVMVVADDPDTLRPVLDALAAAGIRDACASAPLPDRPTPD